MPCFGEATLFELCEFFSLIGLWREGGKAAGGLASVAS